MIKDKNSQKNRAAFEKGIISLVILKNNKYANKEYIKETSLHPSSTNCPEGCSKHPLSTASTLR